MPKRSYPISLTNSIPLSLNNIKQVFHTKLLDFTYDTSFMTDDFFDRSHLDIFGAEKLTKKIKLLIRNT